MYAYEQVKRIKYLIFWALLKLIGKPASDWREFWVSNEVVKREYYMFEF